MFHRIYSPILLLLVLISLHACGGGTKSANKTPVKLDKPNIIYILADDMGYGDISGLNPNAKVSTPTIDSLLSSGMSFSDAHSSSSVCTPSRYSILTGRYAWRTSLKRGVTWGYSPPLIDSARTTVASLLKKQGYTTGCIGKWHLGLNWGIKDGETAPWAIADNHPARYSSSAIDFSKPISGGPNALGFDYFFGIPASLDMRPYCYVENVRVQGLPMIPLKEQILVELDSLVQWHAGMAASNFEHEYVLQTLTEKAERFISDNKKEPFFLYFPLTAPHSPLLPSEEFKGTSSAGDYGDFIHMVDNVVKKIVNSVRSNGLLENTMIIFTSDNGTFQRAYIDAKYEHNGNYIYRGQKADIYEGGHRIPFIVSYQKMIPKNSVSDTPILLNDLMATLADMNHVELDDEEGEDSHSILPILKGNTNHLMNRDVLVHHSSRGFFAIRKDSLKLIQGLGSGGFTIPHTVDTKANEKPYQLYDLKNDVSEKHNLFDQNNPEHAKLLRILDANQ